MITLRILPRSPQKASQTPANLACTLASALADPQMNPQHWEAYRAILERALRRENAGGPQ